MLAHTHSETYIIIHIFVRFCETNGPQQAASSHLTYQDYIRALDRQLIRLSAWKSHSCKDE